MKTIYHSLLVALVITASVVQTRAGLLDVLGFGKSSTNSASTGAAALGALSNDQMVNGLKEALGNGLQHAVASLGHDGGFLTNLNVKIPMPEKLQTVEKTLRALKQDKLEFSFRTIILKPNV